MNEENSPKREAYREIPASILEEAPKSKFARTKRFSRYLFGVGVLAAFGVMGYLAVTNQLIADEGPDVDVDALVAEYEASADSAKRAAALAAADDDAAMGDVRIQIMSDPEGADVEIDGEYVGATPLAHLLRPGAYILSLQRPDFARVDTVLVFVEGGQADFNFNLAKGSDEWTSADRSSDTGLIVEFDGSGDVARTSPRDQDRPAATSGSAQHNEDRSDTERTAQRAATLVVSSHPAGASVLIDGRFVGRTPLSTESIEAGTRTLRLFMEDFEPYEVAVEVETGETATVHGELVARTGELTVLVRPWGSIYVDGVLHEAHTDVRYATNIPAGEHTVVAVHPSLGSVSQKITVRAGNTTNVTLDLEKK